MEDWKDVDEEGCRLGFQSHKFKTNTTNQTFTISQKKTMHSGQKESSQAAEERRPIREGAGEEGRQEGMLKVFQCLIFK